MRTYHIAKRILMDSSIDRPIARSCVHATTPIQISHSRARPYPRSTLRMYPAEISAQSTDRIRRLSKRNDGNISIPSSGIHHDHNRAYACCARPRACMRACILRWYLYDRVCAYRGGLAVDIPMQCN